VVSGSRNQFPLVASLSALLRALGVSLLLIALIGGCDRYPTGPSEPPSNYLSLKDFALLLPDTLVDSTGSHDARVARKFADHDEERLLRAAESTYPPTACVPDGKGGSIDQWWLAEFDGIKVDKHVTRGALAYYLETISRFQAGDFGGAIAMQASSLSYESSIEWKKSVVVENVTYHGVYVAVIRLDWYQVCGNVCGMGFSRTRTVVMTRRGDVIRLVDPVDLGYWVS